MEDVKIPTVGRWIHFFPGTSSQDALIKNNGLSVAPALVIQPFGTAVNLQIFTMNADAPNVLRFSVAHKSTAGEGQSYWDWPDIK